MLPPDLHPSDAGRWRYRAAQLVSVLRSQPDADVRLAILRRFIKGLGDAGFPQFLKLLLIIADSDDRTAHQLIADTYALALSRMDAPGGVLSAWGAGASAALPGQRISAASLASALGAAPRRSFGPIEYVTVWYGQKTQRPYLSADACRSVLIRLLKLFNASPALAALYPAKILADLDSAPEGAFTRQTRARLAQLAHAWQQGDAVPALVAAVIADPAPSSGSALLKDL